MLERVRAPRANKKIEVIFENGNGIIENISTSGGFLKTDTAIPREIFDLKLKISGGKTVKINCKPKWKNESGVGFKVLSVQKSKQQFFNQYVTNQLKALKLYGNERVFRTEIMITLKDTNAFGNVYFSNFIEYQGIIREKFLLSAVPDVHEMLARTNIRLVTVETYNKFINNAFFGDILIAELTTSEVSAATCRLNITFRNKINGNLIGQGYQRICIVSAKGKIIRIPDNLLNPLDFYQEIKA